MTLLIIENEKSGKTGIPVPGFLITNSLIWQPSKKKLITKDLPFAKNR
jgi:hypothetical protein